MKANEEKANEICGGNWRVFNKEYAAALEMADWKDQQFKEYLEKEKEKFHSARFSYSIGSNVRRDFITAETIINKIINELFNNE